MSLPILLIGSVPILTQPLNSSCSQCYCHHENPLRIAWTFITSHTHTHPCAHTGLHILVLHIRKETLCLHTLSDPFSLIIQDAVTVLLKHSADVNARDKNWQTPLHVAASNKAVRCAEALVPLLSNVNVSDRAGRTALHQAAFSGHVEVCFFFLYTHAQ